MLPFTYPSLLLLICDGVLGTLAGTSIGLAALATNGKALSVAETAVATNLGESLNVESDGSSQVAFYDVVLINAVTKLCFVFLSEVLNSGVGVNTCSLEDIRSALSANAVYVSQTDLDPLLFGQVNAGNTCHISQSILSLDTQGSALLLLVLGIFANYHYFALALDYLALLAHGLY